MPWKPDCQCCCVQVTWVVRMTPIKSYSSITLGQSGRLDRSERGITTNLRRSRWDEHSGEEHIHCLTVVTMLLFGHSKQQTAGMTKNKKKYPQMTRTLGCRCCCLHVGGRFVSPRHQGITPCKKWNCENLSFYVVTSCCCEAGPKNAGKKVEKYFIWNTSIL